MREEVQLDDKRVVVLGTAHVSDQSVKDVRQAIDDSDPDTVCVELDEDRLAALRNEGGWRERNVADVIAKGEAYLLLFNILLSIYQRRLGDELDIEPGAEMLAAVEAAEAAGKEVELIDRDINITLKRSFDRLGLLEKLRLLNAAIEGFFVDEDIDVEEIKHRDMLHEVITEFAGKFPDLKKSLIDERDTYMADKIRNVDGETVLAVVGAGHVEGIIAELQSEQSRNEQDLLSTSSGIHWYQAGKYLIPAVIVGMFLYGGFALGKDVAQNMILYWFGLNALTAGIGAVIAGASFVTVGVSAVAAPFTSINPAMPAGLVGAYTENKVRPPRVEDMEGIGEIVSYREMWHNRATKLLLVFFFVNLGSAVSTFVGAGVLARLAGLV